MLNEKEKKTLAEIESKYYMPPILNLVGQNFKEEFDKIYDILVASKGEVEKLIQKRVENREIKDAAQARKSIVGSVFSNLILWLFLHCKKEGLIKSGVFITSKPREVPHYKELFLIDVGGETQKPDVDIAIYSTQNERLKNCLVLSLKTSLRERVGQTYKWKLLMEVAKDSSEIKDRYNISYTPPVTPLVCFATVNFYDEINNPQHRGVFKFFDGSFIGKKIESDFIAPLSSLVDFVNEKL